MVVLISWKQTFLVAGGDGGCRLFCPQGRDALALAEVVDLITFGLDKDPGKLVLANVHTNRST